ENCIPTLEREERSSQHRADAPRFCPKGVGVSLLTKGRCRPDYRAALRVLLATQSVENCIPALEREER
ncbi:hypothetical protein, partial [Pseudomonas syringae]|uniref:hypothetical protein n=1 Tax=Pseudomonas syringae TaxID=317 RepID=UPI0034D5E819